MRRVKFGSNDAGPGGPGFAGGRAVRRVRGVSGVLLHHMRACHGSIAVMAAFTMIPMVAISGLAIETASYFAARSEVQSALDLAALAGARALQAGKSEAQSREILNDTFKHNVQTIYNSSHLAILYHNTSLDLASPALVKVNSKAFIEYTPLLLDIIGVNPLRSIVSSRASYSPVQALEIVFAIDFSSSSSAEPGNASSHQNSKECQLGASSVDLPGCNNRKIDLSIKALEEMISHIGTSQEFSNRNIKIALVPYSSGIRLPRNLYTYASRRPDHDIKRLAEILYLGWAEIGDVAWYRVQQWPSYSTEIDRPDASRRLDYPGRNIPYSPRHLRIPHSDRYIDGLTFKDSQCEYVSCDGDDVNKCFNDENQCKDAAMNSRYVTCSYKDWQDNPGGCPEKCLGKDCDGSDQECERDCSTTCENGYIGDPDNSHRSFAYCTVEHYCVSGRRKDLTNEIPVERYEDNSPHCFSPPIVPLYDISAHNMSIIDAIDEWKVPGAYQVNGSANGEAALLWAWNLLSPAWQTEIHREWPDAATISNSTQDVRKVVVLLTGSRFFVSIGSVPKERSELQNQNFLQTRNQILALSYNSDDRPEKRVLDVCQNIKNDKTEVFIIGFDIDVLSGNSQSTLAPCASGPEYFLSAADGDDLQQAFFDILTFLQNVKLDS